MEAIYDELFRKADIEAGLANDNWHGEELQKLVAKRKKELWTQVKKELVKMEDGIG